MDLNLTAKAEQAARTKVRQILWPAHRDSVEDVLQQAKLNAFKYGQEFRGTASYSTWFYRIAVNQAIMHLRLADNRRLVSGQHEFFEDISERALDTAPNPEEQLLAKERREGLLKAIEGLTPKRREAVKRYLQKDSHRGEHSSEPAFTTAEKTCFFWAIRKLRENEELRRLAS